MPAVKQLGSSIFILLDDVAIECTTEVSESHSTAEIDVSCKDTGGNSDSLPGQNTSEYTVAGILTDGTTTNKDYNALKQACWAGTIFELYTGGVDVGEKVAMTPHLQTIEEIEKEGNEEVRRIRIERFAGADKPVDEGWIRYIRESGAKQVDRRLNERDGQWETLYEFKDGRKRMVVVDPSTGRQYALGVPREMEKAQQAQDWMHHGLDQFAIHRS